MAYNSIEIFTEGEGLYPFTDQVERHLDAILQDLDETTGILFLFCTHTSCALLASENYDPTARIDLEEFFKHIAPKNLPFITHKLEGDDDSPAHMKSALLHQHLAFPVEAGHLVIGKWQGIYLAEFRAEAKKRKILVKFIPG